MKTVYVDGAQQSSADNALNDPSLPRDFVIKQELQRRINLIASQSERLSQLEAAVDELVRAAGTTATTDSDAGRFLADLEQRSALIMAAESLTQNSTNDPLADSSWPGPASTS